MNEITSGAAAVPRARAGDLRLVQEAVLMVAVGGYQRIILTGLHDGASVLDDARRLALARGVRIVPLWGSDEHVAMRVEAIRS